MTFPCLCLQHGRLSCQSSVSVQRGNPVQAEHCDNTRACAARNQMAFLELMTPHITSVSFLLAGSINAPSSTFQAFVSAALLSYRMTLTKHEFSKA